MTTIIIRPATVSDLDALSVLFTALDEHHVRLAPDQFLKLAAPARSLEMLAEMVASDAGAVLLACEAPADRPVGFVHVLRRDLPATIVAPPRTIAEIDTLMVASESRRQGVGARLVEAASRWAYAQGLQALELGVREFNASAIAFYAAMGFAVASRRLTRAVPTTGAP